MRRLEEHEQRALIEWLALQHPKVFEMTFHPPNGGWRTRAESGVMKALGVKPGVPDLIIDWPAGGFHGLRIEMKAPGGEPTPKQVAWMVRLRNQGYRAEVAQGFEEAKAIIEEYLRG